MMEEVPALRLLGMFDFGQGIANGFLCYNGYPLCYDSKLPGGYCFIHPPCNDYFFRNFKKLSNDHIIVPSFLEYCESDLFSAAASSAIWTNYSTNDVPKIMRIIEKELILKVPGNDFFWLPEPIRYETNMTGVSFLKTDLVDLLRTSNSPINIITDELFSDLQVYDELHLRGRLVFGTQERIRDKKRQWAESALNSYDNLLAKFVQTGEGKERIEQLRKGVNIFCSSYTESLYHDHKHIALRDLIVKGESNLERIAWLFFNGDKQTLQKELEQLKKQLLLK